LAKRSAPSVSNDQSKFRESDWGSTSQVFKDVHQHRTQPRRDLARGALIQPFLFGPETRQFENTADVSHTKRFRGFRSSSCMP
jgi:hypothetical protein